MSNANQTSNPDDLQQAGRLAPEYIKAQRTLPVSEGTWRRNGHLVRIKLIDLESAFPDALALDSIPSWKLMAYLPSGWAEIPLHIDFRDGYGRWINGSHPTADTQICFFVPAGVSASTSPWAGRHNYDLEIPLTLWDARARAWCKGLYLYGSTKAAHASNRPAPLAFVENENGIEVRHNGKRVLGFARRHGYQLDFIAAGAGNNLIDSGRVWRWMTTETFDELAGVTEDDIKFVPTIRKGIMLTATLSGKSRAGQMTATLRVFEQNGALVLEFSDYRTVRNRPEPPPEQHKRCYAGQMAGPYADIHYAALTVDSSQGRVFDHLYKYGPLPIAGPVNLVYTGDRDHKGYNWMALQTDLAAIGISVHGRSHHPDHPFKAGVENGRLILALEPFGSEVNGHYHSCDRYMLIIASDVEQVREVFDALDTFPLLIKAPVRRKPSILDTYECLGKWINLNLDYLMRPGKYRNALLTNGGYKDDTDTCLVPVGEIIRLYEKTGWPQFLKTAVEAGRFISDWILSGRFHTRGAGINPNQGGIYQNEQIYLLLSLARVYRLTHHSRLLEAIHAGVQWMYERRGGTDTWGWDKYLWHAGAFDAAGKTLYCWPVNTNQFATLNFRLYQLLGDRMFYDNAMTIMEDYLARLSGKSCEVIRGGGVSDTTRGVHLFAEAIEVAGKDPRINADLWRTVTEKTLERFWVEGWVLIRNAVYAEVIRAGDGVGEIFSPGFSHWHNVGSFLDLLPRIQIPAELGVGESLTRWAARSLAYEFDARYGMEEHTHFSRYAMRDTDIEPATWLDPELMPTLWALVKRSWIDPEDYALLNYRIHRMIQQTFIPLDEKHGGWAALYDSHAGHPIKFLAYWDNRHSHENFSPPEPLEMWGIATREAFHDHSTHFWFHLEQLIDALLKVERSTITPDGAQMIDCREDGLGVGVPGAKALLVPRHSGTSEVVLSSEICRAGWHVSETRVINIGGQDFWLIEVEKNEIQI